MGVEPTAATTPSSIFELVSWYTSQPCAVFCIQVPMSETSWPAKKSRKLRCLSAEKVWRHDKPPMTTRRCWPVTSSGTPATILATSRDIRRLSESAPASATEWTAARRWRCRDLRRRQFD